MFQLTKASASASVTLAKESLRVLVVGDRGCGKTSLVHLMCNGTVLKKPSYTVGCSLDVSLFLDSNSAMFVEWFDVGGSPAFEASRKTWYASFDAIIGVYDVTNANSRNNLDSWFREIIGLHYLDVIPWAQKTGVRCLDLRLHPKRNLAGRQIPVLIVGNKQDLAKELRREFADDVVVSARDASLVHDDAFVAALDSFLGAAVAYSAKAGTETPQQLKLGLGTSFTPYDTASTTPMRSPFSAKKVSEVRLRIDYDESPKKDK